MGLWKEFGFRDNGLYPVFLLEHIGDETSRHGGAVAQQAELFETQAGRFLPGGFRYVEDRNADPGLHIIIHHMGCIGADQDALCPGIDQPAGNIEVFGVDLIPVLGAHDLDIDAVDDQLRVPLGPDMPAHPFVDKLVIGHRGMPGGAPDQSECLHMRVV